MTLRLWANRANPERMMVRLSVIRQWFRTRWKNCLCWAETTLRRGCEVLHAVSEA